MCVRQLAMSITMHCNVLDPPQSPYKNYNKAQLLIENAPRKQKKMNPQEPSKRFQISCLSRRRPARILAATNPNCADRVLHIRLLGILAQKVAAKMQFQEIRN